MSERGSDHYEKHPQSSINYNYMLLFLISQLPYLVIIIIIIIISNSYIHGLATSTTDTDWLTDWY